MSKRYESLRQNDYKILKTSKNIKKNLVESRESEPKEALGAEEVLAIFIRNQKFTPDQIDKEMKNPSTDDFKYLRNYFLNIIKEKIDIKEAIKRVQTSINLIKSFNLPNNASQFGNQQQAPISEWSDLYGGESSPIMPKTDVLNDLVHHSVKMKGAIQILDAGQKQCAALVLYALDQTRELYSENISSDIEDVATDMQNIVVSLSRIPDQDKYDNFRKDYLIKNPTTTMTSDQKKQWEKEFNKAAEKAGVRVAGGDIKKGNVEMSEKVKNQLEEFNKKLDELDKRLKFIFDSSNTAIAGREFKRVFLKESMSGEYMFGGGAASANSVMVWRPGFSDINKMSIDTAVEEAISVFKSPKFGTKSSGNYMYPKAKIGMDLNKLGIKIQTDESSKIKVAGKIVESVISNPKSKAQEISVFVEYGKNIMSDYTKKTKNLKKSLTEGAINEETFWEKIKQIYTSIVNFIRVIGNKLKDYMKQIKDVFDKKASDIFSFFGLEIVLESGYNSVEVTF